MKAFNPLDINTFARGKKPKAIRIKGRGEEGGGRRMWSTCSASTLGPSQPPSWCATELRGSCTKFMPLNLMTVRLPPDRLSAPADFSIWPRAWKKIFVPPMAIREKILWQKKGAAMFFPILKNFISLFSGWRNQMKNRMRSFRFMARFQCHGLHVWRTGCAYKHTTWSHNESHAQVDLIFLSLNPSTFFFS